MTTVKDANEVLRALVRDVVREEMQRQHAPDEWLSLRDARKIANVHHETLARWLREGRLPAGKAGRVYRVRRSDLERFLAGPRRRQRVAELSPEDLANKLFGD